jgi:predicted phage-related endonuclease
MIIHKYNNENDWKTGRLGKVTGTRLKDLIVKRGTKPKKGFYEIIAERVALPPTEENPMERGKRLEHIAIERFEQETGKKANTDLILITRDDNEYIAYSPDGIIGETETIEVKCLNSASHIEAWLTKEIPGEYEEQSIQPFVVNDKLETLYFVFYDPRMPIDFFYFTITREQLLDKITQAYETQLLALAQIAEIEAQLTY